MMRKVDTATGISNILYFILAIIGGMWMPLEVMPPIVQKMCVWLPSFHYGNGVWQIVRDASSEWQNILIVAGYFLLFVVLSKYVRSKQEAAFNRRRNVWTHPSCSM